MTARFSPGRWAIGGAVAVLAGAGIALFSHPQPTSYPPPPGWVQVPCESWPGGKGPCYAPPEQLTPLPPQCGQPGQLPCYTPPAAPRADPATASSNRRSTDRKSVV